MPAHNGDGPRPDALVRWLLTIAGQADRPALSEILHPRFTIIEPACLPWGGTHTGVDAYITLMTHIGEAFEIAFTHERIITEGHEAVLTCVVEFTRRTTGHLVAMPTVEMFTTTDDLLTTSQVYFADPTRILSALDQH
ncbi:nuclear transport factor 2 family protein [Nocardia sp. NBC_01377]|uniref:nuclear transport factor 2 family protein n=1 Tax=Nocardia sp. NBC_01377 TaxID=2903595 RepID=UPI00324C2EF2